METSRPPPPSEAPDRNGRGTESFPNSSLSPSLEGAVGHLDETGKSLVRIYSNGNKISPSPSPSSFPTTAPTPPPSLLPASPSSTSIPLQITSSQLGSFLLTREPPSDHQSQEPIQAKTAWRGILNSYNETRLQFPPVDEADRPITTTTTASSFLFMKQRPLPTPRQNGAKRTKSQSHLEAPERDPEFMYPEWLGSARDGGSPERNKTMGRDKTTGGDGEEVDYDGGSYESGRAGNHLPEGERQEESPWREVTYFRNPLEQSQTYSAPYEPESNNNQDAPERESGGVLSPPGAGAGTNGEEPHPGVYASPQLESQGLADVISRGRIDSVMYVYFGDKFNDYHKEEIAGRIIQVSFLKSFVGSPQSSSSPPPRILLSEEPGWHLTRFLR